MKLTITAYGASLLVSSVAFSDYLGVVEDRYSTTQVDFDGQQVTAYVSDLYVITTDLNDVLLNVYNFDGNHPGPYFQSLTGTGWTPTNSGGPFDTSALRNIDSFVTIGGFDQSGLEPPQQSPGAGAGTALDPNFGSPTGATPGSMAGWYTSNPSTLNGQARFTLRVGLPATFIGRFSYPEPFSLAGTPLDCTWNQGPGTPATQGSFLIACPDSDGDGVDDCVDNCPDDPSKTDPGTCGCGNEEIDTDNDGTADCVDNCPDDPSKTEPGFCGCGTVDTNVNGDVDCDGDYDIDDIRLGMSTFGIEEAEEDTCPADVDGDESIGFSDVLIILNDWGACP